jgi:hypothetical protein
MPCCLSLIVIVAFPRVVLALMFLFSNYLGRAYHHLIVPVLGFVFLPITTIVYAWLVNTGRPLHGVNVLFLILAALIDAGGLERGERRRRGL